MRETKLSGSTPGTEKPTRAGAGRSPRLRANLPAPRGACVPLGPKADAGFPRGCYRGAEDDRREERPMEIRGLYRALDLAVGVTITLLCVVGTLVLSLYALFVVF